jgi:hypothetical protein
VTGVGKRAWIVVVESLRLKEASVADSPSASKAALFGSVPGMVAVLSEDLMDTTAPTPPPATFLLIHPEVRLLGRVEVVGWKKEPDLRIVV